MRPFQTILVLLALIITQQAWAQATVTSHGKASFKECEIIAKACLSAGYTRSGQHGKAFWQDCMRPVLLGQTISGVNLDPKDISACRNVKIRVMQKELQQLQHANVPK